VIEPVEEALEGTLEELILTQTLESSHELPEEWPVIIIQGCLTFICSTIETVNEEIILEPLLSMSECETVSESESKTVSPERTGRFLNINPLVMNTTGLTNF